MFKWKVTYLTCFGAMSVYEEEEFYTAWTKYGVYKKFHKKHRSNLPDDYTDRTHFKSFYAMRKMISFVSLR